jgi:predicted ATPase
VVADESGRTRYRLLETVRQCRGRKLAESGDADAARSRVTATITSAIAALLDAPAGSDYERRLEQAEIEIDNLRARSGGAGKPDTELALALASSLQPLWLGRAASGKG